MKFNELISQDQALTDFLNQTKNKGNSLLTGINSGSLPVLLMQLVQVQQRPLLLVEENEHKAQDAYAALHEALDDETVYLFAVDSTLATAGATASADELASRLDALRFLLSGKPGVVVTTPQGLQMKLSQPQAFKQAKLTLQLEQEYDLEQVSQWLVGAGYTRQPLVARPGEFALRGDILDVYPLNLDEPLRLEFFGDELDAVKSFDPSTQRSLSELKQAAILPATDRVFAKQDLLAAGQALKQDLQAAGQSELTDKFSDDADNLLAGQIPADYAFLIDYLLPEPANLTAYLSKTGLLMFDDWSLIKKNIQDVDQANSEFIKEEQDTGLWLSRQHWRFDWKQVLTKDQHHRLYLSMFQKSMGRIKLKQLYNWPTRLPEQFFSKVELVKTRLKEFAKSKQTVILQADNPRRLRQMSETFAQYGILLPTVKLDSIVPGEAQFLVGDFLTGFVLPQVSLVYLTERELFNAQRHKKRRIKTLDNAQRLRNYTELKPGDYVVHVNHGIGRFEGIKTLSVDGQKRDYITITYQHGDQLFVPAEQLRLVQKYTASEGHRPHINKLGGSEWAKTKRKVAAKVEDIADDLVELYAKRESEKGFAFSPDNEYQREFEAAFPYVETPDQLQAAKEVKDDMEKPRPMDRLLVGDVGFGKTEVALRAAFKAIQDNKQVAFLVPTTILAQQHYQTMQERFKNFPVDFAMLSRFQGAKESKQILAGLADGSIDIVVGTHRLLSKDVHFKDLGLLIIDEEQRFGVKHKEKLKQLKANVDVLTLTATPIPRTLHLSMVGVRDLSVIETPPQNRFPIQTYVMEEMPSVVKEACRREMARNGQIFFLHNRIDDIDETTARLQKMLPEAKIEYIHGRMPQEQLEDVLYRFIHNEFDILVTTTIIETGIDMPNVNTMIIENADRYGLSQLYQLRGRIGRSARLAYAYFLYQPNKVLTEVGEKRLDAIRDFTELGSGFKIAMRDLAIRGAGNMLGKQQHGFIDSVGYDLYAQMLSDAIKNKQGKKQAAVSNAEVNLQVEAYIPDDYISDQEQKIEFYKRIKAAQDKVELQSIEDELVDRFGDYPPAVESLLAVAKLKLAADWAQILLVQKLTGKIKVVFSNRATKELEGPNIFRALEHVDLRARVSLNPAQRLVVLLELPRKLKPRVLFNELATFFNGAGKIVQR
jgi:transcription-repair coupling factor (superfamily II helicase)